jgi:hypothetical protein
MGSADICTAVEPLPEDKAISCPAPDGIGVFNSLIVDGS